jgi:hypothetical protein
LAYFVEPNHLKWEASFQECQPIALGTLGTLVGTLDGTLGAAGAKDSIKPIGTLGNLALVVRSQFLNGKPSSQAASQTNWRTACLTLHFVHLAQLRQVGAA